MPNPCNQTILIGNALQAPAESLKVLSDGKKVIELKLATPREGSDKKDRHTVQFWNKNAELLAEWVQRGDLLSVQGAVRVDLWETDSGEPRQKVYVLGERFQMLESKRSREERQSQAPKVARNAHAPTLGPGDEMLDDDDLPPF